MPHTHKDVANVDMIARMVRAAGRTVGQYDPDQLARLAALRAELDAALVEAVAGQRQSSVTWASIGEALGVTRQAVIQQYGPKLEAREAAVARHWDDTEALGRGEAVPGGPGACSDCHHGKVWHHRGARMHRCEQCDCDGFKATS